MNTAPGVRLPPAPAVSSTMNRASPSSVVTTPQTAVRVSKTAEKKACVPWPRWAATAFSAAWMSAPVAAMAGRAATSGAAHRASPTTPHRATRPLFIAFRRFVAPLIESIAAPRPQPAPADRGAGSRSADATLP